MGLNKVPRPARSLVARLLAKQIASFIGMLPRNANLILHLCYGNLQDTELVAPKDLRGVDVFLASLRSRLHKQGRELPPVHLPAAYGSQPPPTHAPFYQALSTVDPEWKLIAGVVDENDPEKSTAALRLFEAAAGRPAYAVATTCGLGRHTTRQADSATQLMVRLAQAD